MSLNGLDSDAVIQAHQTALAEAGGWYKATLLLQEINADPFRFLLKYATRDTVDLFGHGTGGVGEARKAVESYEEKSPLYGVVQYRRKKFILKYVPEGTSRLLQGTKKSACRHSHSPRSLTEPLVRLAVQFQSILDTFTPHDTVFSFVAAHELSESALGLSTILFSSTSRSSKTSSSSSLRQQRLNEITEDSEEPPAQKPADAADMLLPAEIVQEVDNTSYDQIPSSTARVKALLASRKQEQGHALTDAGPHMSTSSTATAQLASEQKPFLDAIPAIAGPIIIDKELPPPPPPEDSPASPAKSNSIAPRPSLDFSLPQLESDSDDDVRRPVPKEYPQIRYSAHLSAAESTSISKWSDDVLASTVKSNQKRAPKVHTDSQVRPKTSGNNSEAGHSRRANLPTTVRVSNRSSGQSSRPGSQQSTRSVPARFVPSSDLPPPVPLPTIPAEHRRTPSQNRRTPSQASSLTQENPGVTPEKLRLMKALQMRKRKQILTQRTTTAPSASDKLLASIDSSRSTFSDLSGAFSLRFPSDSNELDATSQGAELSNKHESPTTSPTSVVTISDNHSTKPSSFSDDSPKDGSRTSLSSETGSSTTPKAEVDKVRQQEPAPESNGPTEAIQPSMKDLVPFLPLDIASENAESKTKVIRPLTYHCATADFLADIEEEDRERPLSIVEADGPLSTAEPVVKDRTRFPFESSAAKPSQSADTSDESDDDFLMDELQNATVHEAKPVSVARTPATPVLSSASIRTSTLDLSSGPASPPSDRSLPKVHMRHTSRSASNDSQMSTPDLRRAVSRAGSTKSLSTALPQWPPPPVEPIPSLPKQRLVIGASISKRVKTFEGLSQRESVVPVLSGKDPASRSTSLSNMLKRASFLSHSPSEDTPERTGSKTSPSPLRSEFNHIEHESPSKPWLQRPGTSTEVYSPTHKGETVSVTARIVRDPVKPKSAHGTSDTTRSMHMSPLIVEHETRNNLELRPQLPRELSIQSVDSFATSPTPSERRRFSFSSHKSAGQRLSPVENKSYRLSFGGHKKPPKSIGESSSVTDEKRQSRTSRMLRRLSGLGKTKSARSSAAASPTREQPPLDIAEELAEVETDTEAASAQMAMRHVVDVGEVNVQFADTLLWKRRFLRVDDQGYLIFAPPTNDFSTRGKSRKIHLEELHKPALPDLEREEMAWSIVLDLKSGGTVQCACESKSAQSSVLKSKP